MRTFKELLDSRKPELDVAQEDLDEVVTPLGVHVGKMPAYKKYITPHSGKNYLQIAIEHHSKGQLDNVIKAIDDERKDLIAKGKSFKAGMLHDHALKGLNAAKKNLPATDKTGPESEKPLKEEYSPSNPKIDIHVDGKYHASTNWSPTVKHAVAKFKEKYPEHADKKIKAYKVNESENPIVDLFVEEYADNIFETDDEINEVSGFSLKTHHKKAIDAFINKEAHDGKSLQSDGKELSGGFGTLAKHVNGKIHIRQAHGNVSQTYNNYIEKKAKQVGIPTVGGMSHVDEAKVHDDEVGGYKKNKPVPKMGDQKQGTKMGKKSLRDLRAAKEKSKDCAYESVEQIKEYMDVGQAHRSGALQRSFESHLATSKKEAPSAPEHEHHAKALRNAVNQTVGSQHANKFRVTDAAKVVPRGSLSESEIITETWYHPKQVGEIGDGETRVKIYRGKGGAIVTKHYVKGKLVTMEHRNGRSHMVSEAIEITEHDEYEGVKGHPAYKKKDKEEKPMSSKSTYGSSHTADADDEHEIGINTHGKTYSSALGDALLGKSPKVPDEKKMKQLQAAGKARIIRHDENLDIVLVKNGVVYEFAIVEGDEVIGEGRAVTETGALAQAERLIEITGKKMPSEITQKKVVNIAKKVAKYKQ